MEHERPPDLMNDGIRLVMLTRHDIARSAYRVTSKMAAARDDTCKMSACKIKNDAIAENKTLESPPDVDDCFTHGPPGGAVRSNRNSLAS